MNEKQKSLTDASDSLSLQFFDMCSSMHHLFVVPFSFEQINVKSFEDVSYVMLTYCSEETTVEQLTTEFHRIKPQFSKWEAFCFTFSKGYMIPNEWTIRDIKRELKRTNIEGIVLFVYDNCSRLTSSQKFENETCLEDYLRLQSQYNLNPPPLQLRFILPGPQQNEIVINADYLDYAQQLISNFLQELERQFNVMVNLSSIQKFLIKKNQQPLMQHLKLGKHGLASGDQLIVVFCNKERVFLRQCTSSNKCLIIHKSQGQFVKLYYPIVQYETLGKIYSKYFGEKTNKESTLYLKAMDLVIEQNQTFQKAQQYFRQSVQNDKVVIVGRIIDEKTLFYSRMSSTQDTSLIQYSEIEPNQEKRSYIEKQISVRASELKKDKYIRDKSHLQPIYLYTSQASLGGLTIYDGINSYLRTTSVVEISSSKAREQWRYRFIKTLIKRMERIQNTKLKMVYRGVNYVPPEKEGQIIKFQSFLSTSTNETIAYKFPIQQNLSKRIQHDRYSLFVMKIKKAKSISKYSAKRSEQQILLEPYSQFLVKRITNRSFDYMQQPFTFKVYDLIQVNYDVRPYPQIKTNFLLWIDDKLAQGNKIYNQITEIPQPLIFKQFLSTANFKNWLQKNMFLFENKSVNIVVISNMRRQENGIDNTTAGIQGLRELRRLSTSIPVIFYVFHIEGTKAHLKNAQLTQNVEVCNNNKQLISYITKYLSVQFPIHQQETKCSIQ